MNVEPIQHHDQLPALQAMQRAEEGDNIGGHDVVFVKLPIGADAVALRRQRHRSDDREAVVPCRGVLDRRFAARSPSAAIQRLEQEARFIKKDDDSLPSSALFLILGQSCFRQRSMAASSRWEARRCGCCWVKPSACRIRPTWSRWYSTPNPSRITCATRRQVHKLVLKPAAMGPSQTIWASSCFCSGVSRGGRPRFGLAARASLPPWATASFQRLTLDTSTPTSSATSVLLFPFRRRSTARWRRTSSATALPIGLMNTNTHASGFAVRWLCRVQ